MPLPHTFGELNMNIHTYHEAICDLSAEVCWSINITGHKLVGAVHRAGVAASSDGSNGSNSSAELR